MTKKIFKHCQMILDIRYDNANGGSYAYVQFLAYSRELIKSLQAHDNTQRFIDTIESTRWLFNEYLGAKFTHRQKVIFDNQLLELRSVFTELRDTLSNRRTVRRSTGVYHLAA